MIVTRSELIRVGRTYIGTPFLHQGRVKGEGIDCVGFLICLFKEVGIIQSDWDFTRYNYFNDGEKIHEYILNWGDEISINLIKPGDVVRLKMYENAQHAGLISDYGLIHVLKKTCEHSINDKWQKRICQAYRIRNVIDG